MNSSPNQVAISLASSQGNSERDALATAGSLIEALTDAAVLVDAQLQALCFSPQFAALVGIRGKDLRSHFTQGRLFLDLFTAMDLDRRVLEDCLQRAARICIYDVAGKNAKGEAFIVIVSLLPVVNSTGTPIGVACVLRDVSAEIGLQLCYNERSRALQIALEEVTAQAQALAESRQREIALQKSVFAGRLATGLAHEFNSPLACLLANQSYLRSRIEEIMASEALESPAVLELCQEGMDILAEDANSLERLSATVGSLQGFCLSDDPARDRSQPTANTEDILRDVQIAMSASDIDKERIQVLEQPLEHVVANRQEVSMALVSLMQFLLNYEAPESVKELADWEAKQLIDTMSSRGPRSVQLSGQNEGCYYLMQLCCEQLAIDINEAENAFDPSLVVDAGKRVKLSVDLSISASRIARSGGNLRFAKSPGGGTTIEVRLMLDAADKAAA